jgi:hypothetical protein
MGACSVLSLFEMMIETGAWRREVLPLLVQELKSLLATGRSG